ncbi:MAG: LUD domain-containing protein [Deltaproteobacteria bacterium]|nr:LUD domain-containing protein [Deltaproteobacteria bacterium]
MPARNVTLFVPCFVERFHPSVAEASVRLLEEAGCVVDVPQDQTCCGQPAFNAGGWAAAGRAARHFVEVFGDAGTVVCPSGSCVHMVRAHYEKLLPDAAGLADRVHELFTFLEPRRHRLPEVDLEARAVLHEPCHLSRCAGGMDGARALLERAPGIEIVPWALASECCGFGGVFSVKYPELSVAMGRRKLAGLEAAGVTLVVTPDASCMMHLGGIIEQAGLDLRLAHLAEILSGVPLDRRLHHGAGGREAPPAPLTPLERRVGRQLARPGLAARLTRATDQALERRRSEIAHMGDWDERRQRAARIRRQALDRLDEGLETFESNAARAGIVVHRAASAAQARDAVLSILRDAHAGEAVKAKSMLCEELGLNDALENEGIRVVETDLGELIIQLEGEAPSHVTSPSLHVDAREVARRFHEHGIIDELPTGLEKGELARTLAHAARDHLREAFLGAPAAITGGNFIVAETGTLVLVENESNIRLATTLPDLHVALVGIEKLVLEAADLGPLLTLLPVSATGQRQSAAVSLLGAPKQGGMMHVILVDAGRRSLLGDPVLREALACIRCGACMNVCPVFRIVGGHAYGGPYPGPLGLMILEALGAGRGDRDLPFLSTLCGACDDACPVRIPITDVILELRRRHVDEGRAGLAQSLGLASFGLASSRPGLWSTAGRIVDRVLERGAAPGPLGRWVHGRALPRPGRGRSD